MNIFQDKLPQECTLGMEWSVDADTLNFNSPSINMQMTKRGVLSTIAQIYDLLGLISPIALKGKNILQKITAETTPWDQVLEPEVQKEWQNWLQDLANLNSVQFPCCYKAGNVTAVELHTSVMMPVNLDMELVPTSK